MAASSLVKRSYFADALNLAEIQARAHGDDLRGIRTWRERAGDIEPEDDRPEAGDEPVKKKRRRRRRRRRSPAAAKPTE